MPHTPNVFLWLLLGFTLFLSGCSSTLLVQNATLDQILPLFKDYVGINSYQFTYQNDQSRSYRLSLGTLYVPHSSQTIATTRGNQFLDKETKGLTNLTSYEQTTIETVSNPAHYVEATAQVRLVQNHNDVLIHIDTDGPIGTSLDDLQKFIERTGYNVKYQ